MESNSTYYALTSRGRTTKHICKKVRRLLLESLEIAIFLCNNNLKKFGFSQIFSIVNQILPTAYVVNSSYWVFYKCKGRPNACICDRYKFKCLHVNSEDQAMCCIDLSKSVLMNGEFLFENSKKSRVIPSAVDITVYSTGSDESMMIKADIFLRLCYVTDFHLESDFKYSKQYDYKDFYLATEYKLHKEKDDAIRLPYIQFTPNPALHSLYGFYFKKLQNKQKSLRNRIVNSFTSGGITYGDNIPDYTLSVASIKLPKNKLFVHTNIFYGSTENADDWEKVDSIRTNKEDFLHFVHVMSNQIISSCTNDSDSFSLFSNSDIGNKGYSEKYKLISSCSDDDDLTD